MRGVFTDYRLEPQCRTRDQGRHEVKPSLELAPGPEGPGQAQTPTNIAALIDMHRVGRDTRTRDKVLS